MSTRMHALWVQEYLLSLGLTVLLDDSEMPSGRYTFTANSKSITLTYTDLTTRMLADVAAQIQAALS